MSWLFYSLMALFVAVVAVQSEFGAWVSWGCDGGALNVPVWILAGMGAGQACFFQSFKGVGLALLVLVVFVLCFFAARLESREAVEGE